MAVTSSQKNEIRKLIQRRILAKIQKIKNQYDIDQQINNISDESIILTNISSREVKIKVLQAEFNAKKKELEDAQTELSHHLNETCKYLGIRLDSSDWQTHRKDKIVSHIRLVNLKGNRSLPGVTEVLELMELANNLEDILILTTTEKAFRGLVERINTRLGITEQYQSIIGTEEPFLAAGTGDVAPDTHD